MQPSINQVNIREAVGLFHDIDDVSKAVAELEGTAFPRHHISVLAGDAQQKAEYGTANFATSLVEDSSAAPRTVLVRPEEKTICNAVLTGGGVYAGVITALAIALPLSGWPLYGAMIAGGIAGGAIGGLTAWAISQYYNNYLRNQIDRGGIVLWVHTPGPNREALACNIMRKHGGSRVHVHEIS